jgi:hypothetical protein
MASSHSPSGMISLQRSATSCSSPMVTGARLNATCSHPCTSPSSCCAGQSAWIESCSHSPSSRLLGQNRRRHTRRPETSEPATASNVGAAHRPRPHLRLLRPLARGGRAPPS